MRGTHKQNILSIIDIWSISERTFPSRCVTLRNQTAYNCIFTDCIVIFIGKNECELIDNFNFN